MSEDGYTMIFKDDDGQYRGYACSASCEYETAEQMREILEFEVDTIEEAICKAQSIYHEYGFQFYEPFILKSLKEGE